jgi:hypothetical protein
VLSDHVQPSHLVTTAPPAQPLLLSIRCFTLIAKTAMRVARADGRSGQKPLVGFLVSNKALPRFFGSADSKGLKSYVFELRIPADIPLNVSLGPICTGVNNFRSMFGVVAPGLLRRAVCSRSRHGHISCRRVSHGYIFWGGAMCRGICPQTQSSDFENYREDQGAFGGLFVDVAF